MHKRSLLILLFLVVTALLAVSCSRNDLAVVAKPGEVFTLGVGQTAEIAGEDMTITFDEVIGDSRAPQNVNAIWEGVANSSITITYGGNDYQIVLRHPGRTDRSKEAFIDYTLIHSLNPYPRAGEEIRPKDYRLTLTVTE